MSEKKVKEPESDELRRRAEERLGENTGSAPPPGGEEEPLRLLHELQVHRIELEMQNAELRQAIDERENMELLLGRFSDLYDFAPVGYMTLARNGEIRAVNLTCARFLGIERSRLVTRQIHHLVAETDSGSLTAFLDSIFSSQGEETCEVTLLKERWQPLYVRMEAFATESGEECHLALIDISKQKQLQKELTSKNNQLENALVRIKQLEGIVPICTYCRRKLDDSDSMHRLKNYITEHSEAIFNHGACPECLEKEMRAANKAITE